MTKKELIEKLDKFDDDAEIVMFNRTSRKWFSSGNPDNFPIETVEETMSKCGQYARKQLERFDKSSITIVF